MKNSKSNSQVLWKFCHRWYDKYETRNLQNKTVYIIFFKTTYLNSGELEYSVLGTWSTTALNRWQSQISHRALSYGQIRISLSFIHVINWESSLNEKKHAVKRVDFLMLLVSAAWKILWLKRSTDEASRLSITATVLMALWCEEKHISVGRAL